MCEKYLKDDTTITELKDALALHEYLSFRQKNDIWVQPYINECQVIGYENNPLFNHELLNKEIKLSGTLFEGKRTTIEVGEEDLNFYLAENGLFLTFPMNNKMETYPTRYTSRKTINARAGIEGTSINNTVSKPILDVLPVIEKAAWLTRGMSLHKSKGKLLIRDGAISTFASQDYEILSQPELIACLEKYLYEEHPDFCFLNGWVSHEYLIVEYLLNNSLMESSLLFRLKDLGVEVDELKMGISFSTSDVTNATVSLSPFLFMDGRKIFLSRPVKVRHDNGNGVLIQAKKNENSISFEEILPKMAVSFSENEAQIENLATIDIHCPGGCFMRLATEKRIFSLESSKKVYETISPNYCTAMDIFLLLNGMVEAARNEGASPTKIIQLTEEVARLMFVDFSQYDKPYVEQ